MYQISRLKSTQTIVFHNSVYDKESILEKIVKGWSPIANSENKKRAAINYPSNLKSTY